MTYSAASTGGSHDRTESGDASGTVMGSYSLTHAGGSRRKVDYSAGGAGFKATVYTNEQGLVPGEDPADISILALAGAAEPFGAAGGAGGPSGGAYAPFNFMYSAAAGGGSSSRSESGDVSGNVVGSYSVEDPDGRRRKVDYTAGSEGFKANIQSNEPGVEPGSNPADVEINAYAGLPMIPAGGPADAPAAGAPAAGAPGDAGVGGAVSTRYIK
ncbi:adult-specific rigid cuticular protein 15.5-like [Limulus polyphemus]|uniref:Adult-specific rigid cuticular protein 15.5-like n=1 Tax=Limulus polyphemus TaxID=6850 RepID=A0ABM1RZX0_LIMPO|nr:adult-specific rigid cuticular protein 15.5-like [Limulus polyphemus]